MAFIDVTSNDPDRGKGHIRRHSINSDQIYRIDHEDDGCTIFFAVANSTQTFRLKVRESADTITQQIREREAVLSRAS